MKIIVDAYGGDNAPREIVKGGVDALKEQNDFSVIFTGKKTEIESLLAEFGYSGDRVEIIDCAEVIGCDEVPTVAIKSKPDSSLAVGCSSLRLRSDADALVSAGSTGAVLAGGLLKVGRVPGISRPALAPILPTTGSGRVLLIDSGANADCKSINLIHFALMGDSYMRLIYGIDRPRIGLLSNGSEDNKGNELTHVVFKSLSKIESLNFIGNVEARDILLGKCDVVVCDGFSGNVALKSMEGAVKMFGSSLKDEVKNSFGAKIGYLLMKKSFNNIKKKLDFNSYGGAVFLGLVKPVIKTHGAAKSNSVKNSVLQAVGMVKAGVVDKIKDILSEIDFDSLCEKENI